MLRTQTVAAAAETLSLALNHSLPRPARLELWARKNQTKSLIAFILIRIEDLRRNQNSEI